MNAGAARPEQAWPADSGAMGALLRGHDWAATPLGPIEGWPQSLRTIVDLMLAARQPVYIAWGPDFTSLYNDALIPILGTKHPDALGRPFADVWAEIWEEYRPILQETMAGKAQHFVDRAVPLLGRDNLPVSWFTFSWTPLRNEAGTIAGFFCAATETTEKIRADDAQRAHRDAALHRSEQRYRTLFESMDEGFCILQLIFDAEQRPVDCRYIEINPAFERHTGMRGALGRTIRELVPAIEPFWFDIYGKVAMTGEPARFVDHVRSMGRWFDVYACRIGEPADRQVAVIFNDITDPKRNEEALRESEKRFRLMADAVPAIVWITDAEGRVEFFNRQWSDYTGVPYGPKTADIATAFVHPDDGAGTAERFQHARRTGGTFLVEHRIRSKAGEYRWFLVRGEPYRDPGTGDIARWFGASFDIHDRKMAEAALRTSEERYRGLVETQADLIVRIGADGRFTFANTTTCRTLGRPRGDLLKSRWSQFVFADDVPAVETAIEEARALPDHRNTVEARVHTVNGLRWFAWEGYVIFNDADDLVELQAVGRDITERRAIEDALRLARDEAERAREAAEQAAVTKSKFLAAASHDLRQPMQSLLLFLDVLKPYVAPRGQEPLKHLGRGLDALRDLLDSLLDISRLDAGVVVPTVEDFSVGHVVEQLGAAYTPIAAAKGLALRVEPCTAVVRSDRTLLGRMVRNLIENALRYTEAGGIAIACRAGGGHLRIEVADTGIGIPAEHLERIWEEFHQVGNPERDRNRGLGLGLAIVQRLSALLRHPVDVRSAPGRGSVFSIEVPLGGAESRPAPPSATVVVGNGRLAVLVDDDAIVLLGLKATFEGWGYEVLAAGSADRALAALQALGRRPDIVVADYRLREGRNGTEVILRVREAYGADIPGIILTGETGTEVQRDAAEHTLSIIHKPVTPRQLSMALATQTKAGTAGPPTAR